MSAPCRILFVCEANVCRSPLMAAVFRAAAPVEQWEISSRGTRVPPGAQEICSTSAKEAGVEIGCHLPTEITAQDVAESTLVLTASRAERSAVVRLDRSARAKTFTLLEALRLGASTDDIRSNPTDTGATGVVNGSPLGTLEEYGAYLHSRRGLIDTPDAHPRRALFRKARMHPFDIPDVHGLGSLVHGRTLKDAASSTRALADQVMTSVRASE